MCGERDGDSSRRGARGQALPATPRTRRLPGCVHYGARIGEGPSAAPASTVGRDPTAVGDRRRIQRPASVPPAGHRAIGRATTLEGAPMAEVAGGGRSGEPDGSEHQTVPEATLAPGLPPVRRVGRGFIALYAAAYMGTSLMLVAPLLVTLALKVNAVVGAGQAATSLALVTGAGSLLAMVANPVF